MSGSDRAASAGQMARGNRIEDNEDYAVVLPTLPTGSVVNNTVFFHCDVKGRPYRVEDLRDALQQPNVFGSVVALGPYQMNHVWAATFNNAEAAKKIVATQEIKVKGRKCLVIDPCNRDIRVKLHWVLHNVPDEEIKKAFQPYGRVTELTREKWRVQGCDAQCTMTRVISLQLKAGVAPEDIPQQMRIAGDRALVAVPGRPPQCLRCEQIGHIRRDCRVPRCSVCRRFGHEAQHCVKTYAVAATTPFGSERSELTMDEAEAEEINKAADDAGNGESGQPTQDNENHPKDIGSETQESVPCQPEVIVSGSGNAGCVERAAASPSEDDDSKPDIMEVEASGEASTAAKRSREENGPEEHESIEVIGEPPRKAGQGRRATPKAKLHVPPDRAPRNVK